MASNSPLVRSAPGLVTTPAACNPVDVLIDATILDVKSSCICLICNAVVESFFNNISGLAVAEKSTLPICTCDVKDVIDLVASGFVVSDTIPVLPWFMSTKSVPLALYTLSIVLGSLVSVSAFLTKYILSTEADASRPQILK